MKRRPVLSGWIVGILALVAMTAIARQFLGPVTCRDGWQSQSIGRRGACSWHGGVDRSRDGLFFIFLAVSGLAGFMTFSRLEEADRPRKLKCPKCHAEMSLGGKCARYPLCPGTLPPSPQPTPMTPRIRNPKPPRAASAGTGCPICSAPMVRRKAKQGQYRGKSFYGCSRYPACTGIRRKR
jgi:Topoisomerase DNA binding C4 zinc finger